jgi:hypothetical protein
MDLCLFPSRGGSPKTALLLSLWRSQVYSPSIEVFLSFSLLSFSYRLTQSLKLSAKEH